MFSNATLNNEVSQAWILTFIDEYVNICEELDSIPKLRLPNFCINNKLTKTLGAWDSDKRMITISESLLSQGNWDDVVAVLKHEMAHQIVTEYFGVRGEEPHGHTFKKACKLLQIPHGPCYTLSRLSRSPRSNLLRKIEKLLALGQSSNPHEAGLALAKAHELSLKYNVALQDKKENSSYALRLVGPILKRTPPFLWQILTILEEFYFIRYIQRPRGRPDASLNRRSQKVFELYGTAENLDLAEYVYYFLLNHGNLEWCIYRDKHGLANNKLKVSFLEGMYAGFRAKLRKRHCELTEQSTLIWIGDCELDRFYRQRNPYIRKSKNTTMIDRESHKAGHEIGGKLEIKPGLTRTQSQRTDRLLLKCHDA